MDNQATPIGNPEAGQPWRDQEPDPQGGKVSLLFVDDDAYMRRLMAARFEHLGAQVEAVASAQDALAFLESHRPDLLVLDAVMPGMNGFDLSRRIKGDPLLQSIPVVILTALARDLRQRSLEAGADDFLSKLEHEVVFRLRARLALELGRRLATGADDPPVAHGTLLVASASGAVQTQLGAHLRPDGIQAEGAETLADTLRRVQASVPELLALDLGLAARFQDLEEWIIQLRNLPGASALPILALATKEEEPWLAPLEQHIQDRLLKPLDGQDSRHRVKLLLRIGRLARLGR
jgi:CheY-like chemotaxis protein